MKYRVAGPVLFFLAWLLIGCQTVPSVFYSANGEARPLSENGIAVTAPESWVLFSNLQLEPGYDQSGFTVTIRAYKWSPVIQFNRHPRLTRWEEDMPRLEAKVIQMTEMDVKVSEELTAYDKFVGHGVRKIGRSRGHRQEFIIFYPEGDLIGSRLFVLLYGIPNDASLKEMADIIRSVRYDSDAKHEN